MAVSVIREDDGVAGDCQRASGQSPTGGKSLAASGRRRTPSR